MLPGINVETFGASALMNFENEQRKRLQFRK